MSYKISVVTPFCNVDMKMFRKCFESVKNQTLGFENIQWIVVVHNSEQKYHEAVHELLDGFENVIVKRLDNDIRNPSPPRNLGMKLATAPYLGFLDADDGYTPQALEKALYHLQKTTSQIVTFRRQYELERDDLMPWTELVLWDQTQEEIVLDREHWDDKKMFSGLWAITTSRLYDRNFLSRNNITFDETLNYGEGVHFLIAAYGKADRVCYLPQFIGYNYFINSGSIVQSMKKKSGAMIVSYAASLKKVFDAGFRNGIYMDWTIAALLTMYSSVLVHTKNLTLAERFKIKEILEPYVHMIPFLPVTKIDSAETVRTYYELPREVILQPENFSGGSQVQSLWNGQKILNEILRRNQSTDYGQRYHFSTVHTAEGYQARVPLSDYETYAPFVELQTKVGESCISTAEPVPYYLLTSSTTGKTRLIQTTQRHFQPYLDAFTKIVRDKTTFALFESLPMKKSYNDKSFLNSVSGMVLSEFFRYERNTLASLNAKFTSPEVLMFPQEAMDTMYLRLLFALKERDVEQIFSPFTWSIVEAFAFLENNWESLCNDIELGKITFALDVPEKFLRSMNSLLLPDKVRAEELREIFREGFDKPVAQRIWKKLNQIIAAGTGSFKIYTAQMKRYIGDVAHSNGFFASSEMLMGRAIDGTDNYELIPDLNFYEFLPVDDTRPIFLSDVEVGKDYEIILTNQAGLYRYRTEDIVRVVECGGGKLIFSYVGRKNDTLKLSTASISENDIYETLAEVEKKFDLGIVDFAFFAENERLRILLEPKKTFNGNTTEIISAIDETLCRKNFSYAAARKNNLPCCKVDWNQVQTHLLYRDVERFTKKTAPDQIKPTHLLNTADKIKFFLSNT